MVLFSGVAVRVAVGSTVNQPDSAGAAGSSVSVVTGASGGGGGAASSTVRFPTSLSFWLPAPSVAIARIERAPALAFAIVAVAFTPSKLFEAHTRGLLDLSKLEAREQAVLRRATALDPAKRFPTCTAFLQELRAALTRGS